MREKLEERCELLVQNRDRIKSAFSWESAYIYPLCATLYTAKGETVQEKSLARCRALLKQKTGVFSNFRGTIKMTTITMLALAENPEEMMEQILEIYDRLKELFWGSEYLAATAAVIADLAKPSEHEKIIWRTREIYDSMKRNHPFLTGSDDSTFAALLAMTSLDDIAIEQEAEECYRLLKPEFFSGNAVQSLSHVLALGEASAGNKANKVMALYEALRSRGYKYGTSYELPTLGVLALLDTPTSDLARDIIEVDDFLKTQKGFGAFGVGAKQRMMYAGMMTMCDYVPEMRSIQAAALNGVVSLVIAQQAAICASIAAASAASAAASSSST